MKIVIQCPWCSSHKQNVQFPGLNTAQKLKTTKNCHKLIAPSTGIKMYNKRRVDCRDYLLRQQSPTHVPLLPTFFPLSSISLLFLKAIIEQLRVVCPCNMDEWLFPLICSSLPLNQCLLTSFDYSCTIFHPTRSCVSII